MLVKAPNDYPKNKVTVFLAGSIDMGKSTKWADALYDKYLKKWHDLVVLNPRRDDWDSSWKQEASDPQFSEQVNWEQDGIEASNIVIFYYEKDSKSPITLLEMGQVIAAPKGRKIAVICPTGFYRKGNVDIVCQRANVPVFEDLAELDDFIYDAIITNKVKN